MDLHKSEKIGFSILLGLSIFLLILCFRTNTIHYDTYDYLLNAKHLAGYSTFYNDLRAPFLPLLLLPLIYLGKFFNSPYLAERTTLFIATFSGIFSLYLFWRLLRENLPKEFVIYGILALAFNSLFLHFWILFLPEIPAFFLVTIFWFAILKKRFLIVGISLGLILILRYQFFTLSFLGIIYSIIVDRKNWLALIKNWSLVALISAAILVISHYYSLVWGADYHSINDIFKLLSRLKDVATRGSVPNNSLIDKLSIEIKFLIYYVTSPVLIISLIGIVKAFRRQKDLDWLFLIWFFGLLLTISSSFDVSLKEPRYSLSYIPSIYYFFVEGLSITYHHLIKVLTKYKPGREKIYSSMLLLTLAVSPLMNANLELLRLCDESYTNPLARNLGQFLAPKLSSDEPVFWVGQFYTIAPKSYYFNFMEKYFFFNFHSNTLGYYLNRRCYDAYAPVFSHNDATGRYVVVNRNFCRDYNEVLSVFAKDEPLTVHKVEGQTRYYPTNRTEQRVINNEAVDFSVFTSKTGENIYLRKLSNIVIVDVDQPQSNVAVQFIRKFQFVPPKPNGQLTFFSLPSRYPILELIEIADIEFILVNKLSPSLKEFN